MKAGFNTIKVNFLPIDSYKKLPTFLEKFIEIVAKKHD